MLHGHHGPDKEADEGCSEACEEGLEGEEESQTQEGSSDSCTSAGHRSLAAFELWLESAYEEAEHSEFGEMLRCALALYTWIAESCRTVHSRQD